MGRYIDGHDRTQSVLFPERLDDWIDEDNPVRAVESGCSEPPRADQSDSGIARARLLVHAKWRHPTPATPLWPPPQPRFHTVSTRCGH
jgi:hypothetical protein